MTATIEKPAGFGIEFSASNRPALATLRPRVRVWLTDDNMSFRNSLAQLLGRTGEFDCERQFHSAESLLEALAQEPAPDVILLDIEMDGMTGVDALRPIRALAPNVRVLMVTTFFDPMYDARASRNGASAYVLKAFAAQNIEKEIYRALTSPVRPAEIVPVDSTPATKQSSRLDVKSGADLNFTARLALWMAHLFTALFGQLEYHRPATPK